MTVYPKSSHCIKSSTGFSGWSLQTIDKKYFFNNFEQSNNLIINDYKKISSLQISMFS